MKLLSIVLDVFIQLVRADSAILLSLLSLWPCHDLAESLAHLRNVEEANNIQEQC